MKQPPHVYAACHASLLGCLSTVAEHCPDLPTNTPSLHRIQNLVQVLNSSAPVQGISPVDGLSIPQAITILSTSQDLLATLSGAQSEGGQGGQINEEMRQALTEAVADLKARLGTALRQKQARRVLGLYVIIDPEVTGGRDPLAIATAAINGGARMLQLRDKLRDKGEVLPLAVELQKLCLANDADLIVNDHADLAAAVSSAGLHVGQTDLPVAQARKVLSPHQVIGRSNHEMEELTESQEMGVDHVAFGAVYATGTKGVGRPPQGPDRLRRAKELTQLPLVAIGGINAENVAPVVQAGADAVCVTAAVGLAPEPEAAAARLVEAIRNAGGRA